MTKFLAAFCLLFILGLQNVEAQRVQTTGGIRTMTRSEAILTKGESQALFAEAMERGLSKLGLLLVIDTTKQRAELVGSGGSLCSYTISCSKYGVGNREGSNRTPLGWHAAKERYGARSPIGSVFVSRKATGRILKPDEWQAPTPAEDLVLTRIIWLDGLEPGVNSGKNIDSHTRCIYLHGTNQEQLLGEPASHGCIRFSNRDIIHLFQFTEGIPFYCFIR